MTGRVWNDTNHNGRQDKGEKGVAGARIVLTFGPGDSTTKVYGPVATGADGTYVIRKIEPNVPGVSGFTVAVATPGKGWTFTKPGIGADRGDSDFVEADPGAGPTPRDVVDAHGLGFVEDDHSGPMAARPGPVDSFSARRRAGSASESIRPSVRPAVTC